MFFYRNFLWIVYNVKNIGIGYILYKSMLNVFVWNKFV